MGELLAITWEAIDLEGRTLRVMREWDEKSRQFLAAKSDAGQNRVVPMVDRLGTLLADHRVVMNHPESGLLFPGAWDSDRPASGTGLRKRAASAWEAAGLEPLGFHEGRHTFASLMIAARREREGAVVLHGAREYLDHAGSIWPSDALQRSRGPNAVGRLSRP